LLRARHHGHAAAPPRSVMKSRIVGKVGTEIAKHLINEGYRVLGSARSPAHVGEEAEIVFPVFLVLSPPPFAG
jgi:hypothetical protein